ncbi:MAG: peptidylprolyl isomerase [Thermoprotei archaeon]|nr:MAG: peptidylprolyl isomerase [Thermoprotei archaeon]
MPFEKNEFLLVDYTMKVKETGELVDTTIADVAKKEGKYESDRVYEPVLVIVGEKRLIQGFEEDIEKNGEVGVERTIEVPPEKAYGRRDPRKVRTLSARELLRAGITPEVGKVIEYGNSVGVIKSVSGGRVLVDFNHPLAGRTMVITYRVVKKIEDPAEKIRHLLHRRLKRVPLEKFRVELRNDGKTALVEIPPEAFLERDLQIAKAIVAEEVYRYIGSIDTVVYQEKYTRKKGEEPSKKEESSGKSDELPDAEK